MTTKPAAPGDPERWASLPLSDVAGCRGGYGFPHAEQGAFGGSMPFFKVSDMTLPGNSVRMITANNYVNDAAVERLRAKPFPSGAVIFPKIGGAVYTNKKRQLTELSLIDNNVMAVWSIEREVLDDEFLYFFLLTVDLATLSSPGPLPSITQQRVREVLVPIPPIEEQRAITDVLRTIQRAKEQTSQVLAAAKHLKRSGIEKLFSAESRTQRPLEQFLREPLKNGRSAVTSLAADAVPTLSLSAVTNSDFSPKNIKFTALDRALVRDLWLQEGDILVERANTRELVGTAAIYEGPPNLAVFPDLMIRLRVDSNMVRPKVLAEYLATAFVRRYFRKNASGTAGNMPKISQQIVRKLDVPVLTPAAQHRIEEWARALDRKIAAERGALDALDHLFKSSLRELMSGRTRVGQDQRVA